MMAAMTDWGMSGPGVDDWLNGDEVDIWKEDLIDFFGE
jgi:hypothetical protein